MSRPWRWKHYRSGRPGDPACLSGAVCRPCSRPSRREAIDRPASSGRSKVRSAGPWRIHRLRTWSCRSMASTREILESPYGRQAGMRNRDFAGSPERRSASRRAGSLERAEWRQLARSSKCRPDRCPLASARSKTDARPAPAPGFSHRACRRSGSEWGACPRRCLASADRVNRADPRWAVTDSRSWPVRPVWVRSPLASDWGSPAA